MSLVEPSIMFFDENIEKIESVILNLDQCTTQSLGFIGSLFGNNCNLISDLKLDLWFSRKIKFEKIDVKFISKFEKLQNLSMVLVHANECVDLIFDELERGKFNELKKFELAIRCTTLLSPQILRLANILEQMKTLKHLTLEILHVQPSQKAMNTLIESLYYIPFLNLRVKLNAQFTMEPLRNLSGKCRELSMKIENGGATQEIYLDQVKNLAKLEIDSLPNSRAMLNSYMKELIIGDYASNLQQLLKNDFLLGNTFDNLKRLELIHVGNVLDAPNVFPSLEYVHCSNCSFRSSIEFFSNSRKLKSLVLKFCVFETRSTTELRCKELEELDITTSGTCTKFLDIPALRGLKLKKLTIFPVTTFLAYSNFVSNASQTLVDLSAIEEMSSLEYLNLGEYYDKFSFDKLTNLKYLEIRDVRSEGILSFCTNDHLLHNCIIHFENTYVRDIFPTYSENGIAKVDKSIHRLIISKLKGLGCHVKGVKFVIISTKYIYVSFHVQSKKQLVYSFPSFILISRKQPYSILASGRSFEKKQEKFEDSWDIPPNVDQNKCDIQ
ncbi:predicted protein [Naegleria gruberi]|uniref:Predicted protein n=1 Tax=Naegleria gruberi TaxID=5762 RepID=D2VVM2_NAEGR|nr:uncharacterized protein NAEGRDRAFT_73068 [Naegleria gruberi]EFC39065.1 predicted protein [Naegleria gruberi]|eukprot:XP_002671809.1 predicted protein [Naegleria gruberi strain NEG-M]